MTTSATPSARAAAMLAEAKRFADREVRRHLDAGRSVYGRLAGIPVVIHPRRVPCNQPPTRTGTISWAEHLRVHAAFVLSNSGREHFQLLSAERIAELGGYGYSTATKLLGHAPVTWRKS